MWYITKESDVIQSGNLGIFYKFVNKRLKYRSTIGALVDNSGNTITNDTEKANLLNDKDTIQMLEPHFLQVE